MFGQSSRSVTSAFVHTRHLPASFHLSPDRMRSCASLHRRLEPFSQQAARSALLQHGKALNSMCTASFSGRNADSELAGGGSSIPQPQASNAGASSTNTSHETPSTARSNGAATDSTTDQSQQQPGNTNISDLQVEVSKLSELVTNQARMLQEQMKDLEHARSLIDMHAMTNTLSASAPTQTIKAGWDKNVKPFEVQRNAIGDRRYLGGYDARFHSTNK